MRGETQHWAAMSLFDMPWRTRSATWRSIGVSVQLGGRVTLAGGLPGRPQLLGGARGERFGAQVLERLERGPQVGAGVDAALGATQKLPVREVGAGPVVGPATGVGVGVVGQRALEQGGCVGGFGEQGTSVVDGGQRPRPPGAVGERGQLFDPGRGLLVVAGPDGGLDAVDAR